jgi:hypothetical protein
VVKALTHHARAPQPTQRRRRTEETRGGFKLAAVKIMRRVVRSIFHPDNFTWDAPAELDDAQRLHFWQWNNQASMSQSYESENFHYAEQNHLSPHL